MYQPGPADPSGWPPPGSPAAPFGTTAHGPPAREPQARASHLAIPYLGPDPAPSARLTPLILSLCAIGAVLRVALAWALLRRADLDRMLARQVGPAAQFPGTASADGNTLSAPDLARSIHRNASLLGQLDLARLVTWVVLLVAIIVWHQKRRPKAILAAYGETHVESNMRWAQPPALRLAILATLAVALFLVFSGSPTASTPIADLARYRVHGAIEELAFGAFWVLEGVMVVLAQRSHAARLAASQAARQGLVAVAYVAPTTPTTTGGAAVPSVRLGWILRSAVIGFVSIVAITAILIGGAQHDAGGITVGLGGVVALLAMGRWARRSARKPEPAPSHRSPADGGPPPTGPPAWFGLPPSPYGQPPLGPPAPDGPPAIGSPYGPPPGPPTASLHAPPGPPPPPMPGGASF